MTTLQPKDGDLLKQGSSHTSLYTYDKTNGPEVFYQQQENDDSFFNQDKKESFFQRIRNAYQIYDRSVVAVMCFTYFLQGFRVFHMLSVKDLFKLYLGLQPDYT